MRRKVVTLCGSTRFRQGFERAAREETLAGNVVLSVGLYGHEEGIDAGTKEALDRLHRDKISMSDEVLVIDLVGGKCRACDRFCHSAWCPDCSAPVAVGPYIGASTRAEIEHACRLGLPVRFASGGPPLPGRPLAERLKALPDLPCEDEAGEAYHALRRLAERFHGGGVEGAEDLWRLALGHGEALAQDLAAEGR